MLGIWACLGLCTDQQSESGQKQIGWEQEYKEQPRKDRPGLSPFVVTELVAMVVCGDDVDEQYVLGLGVHACDFYLVAGEHPPEGVKGGGGTPGEMTE